MILYYVSQIFNLKIDREYLQMCCNQNALKSKLKNNYINPIVDKMPYDLIQSGSSNNNIKINVSSKKKNSFINGTEPET